MSGSCSAHIGYLWLCMSTPFPVPALLSLTLVVCTSYISDGLFRMPSSQACVATVWGAISFAGNLLLLKSRVLTGLGWIFPAHCHCQTWGLPSSLSQGRTWKPTPFKVSFHCSVPLSNLCHSTPSHYQKASEQIPKQAQWG